MICHKTQPINHLTYTVRHTTRQLFTVIPIFCPIKIVIYQISPCFHSQVPIIAYNQFKCISSSKLPNYLLLTKSYNVPDHLINSHTLRHLYWALLFYSTLLYLFSSKQNFQLSSPMLSEHPVSTRSRKSIHQKNELHLVILLQKIHSIGLHFCISLRNILFHETGFVPFHLIPNGWNSNFVSYEDHHRPAHILCSRFLRLNQLITH